jgi:hypothetical protein
MPVLFFTDSDADYLSDSLFHGLRSILGNEVIDFPKVDRMYKTYPPKDRSSLYGRGFTLYGLLEDIPVDRSDIESKLRNDFFDCVVFGSIWRNWRMFSQIRRLLNPRLTVLVDGEDADNVFPFSRTYLRQQRRAFIPRAREYRYYKRELTTRSVQSLWYFLLPRRFTKLLPFPARINPISFSIPEEKLVACFPQKTKDFPVHIVDEEIAAHFDLLQPRHPFHCEAEYYADLQSSRFGITTKRSGWDCMRHYEIAANGAVVCFKELDKKEPTCAPHGLNPVNSIAYENFSDLGRKIDQLSATAYENLVEGSLAWARRNTTAVRAKNFLSSISRASA